MAIAAATTLPVEFVNSAYLSSTQIRLEVSNRESEDDNVGYFRVHGANGHTITATSGSVIRENSNLKKFVSEFLYFNGTNATGLSYPGAIQVQLHPYPKFYTPTGNVVAQPGIYYSAAKNELKANQPLYGMVLVEYKSPYDLYRAKFGGSCPSVVSNDPAVNATTGAPDDDQEYEGLDPMVVYAWKDGVLEASLPLSPPPCKYADPGNYAARAQMDAGTSSIKIEVDPDYPVRYINTAGVISSPEAGCKIRIYPGDTNAVVTATSGDLLSKEGTFTATIRETVQFNNQSSARLRYQPSGQVAVWQIGGRFIDKFGREFTPRFATNGDSCRSVEWISQFAYQNPVTRDVDPDEIVVTSAFRNAIPSYGAAEVEYTTSYDLREYRFEFDTQILNNFVPATVVAKRGRETGTLRLNPPSLRGFY